MCHFAKQKQLPYQPSNSKASCNFHLLHFDLWGPFGIPSIHGHRFFLTIVDDHSRFCWTIMLKSKSEVPTSVQNFISLVEKQFDAKVEIVRTDNGTKFFMPQHFNSKDIIHQQSCIETPQ